MSTRSLRSCLILLLSLFVSATALEAQIAPKVGNSPRAGNTKVTRPMATKRGPRVIKASRTDVIAIEGLPAGTIVEEVFSRNGLGPIAIRGYNPAFPDRTNTALIFDTTNPTGGDDDLGTPNQAFGGPGIGAGGASGPFANDRVLNNVLIVGEDLVDADNDGLVDDPDDGDLLGSAMMFDFSAIAPVTMTRINYLDIESKEVGATIELFGDVGQSLALFDMPPTGDNGRFALSLGPTAGVYRAVVTLHGSGAIDYLAFQKEQDCSAVVGDFVWHDLDCDGLQDPGEPGLEGVQVTLADGQDKIIGSQATGPDGSYAFTGLCAGTYWLRVDESTLPPGFTAAPCKVGIDPSVDNDCSPTNLVLATDQTSDRSHDFGYCSPCTGTIGDFVWHDLDCDGLQDDDEPGLEGVLVQLRDSTRNVIATQTTGPNGAYTFTGLCGGGYIVAVDESTLPPGFVPAPCDTGSDDSIDNDCSPARTILSGQGDSDEDTDFGYCVPCTGTIGDLVWLDTDCDGIQDAGDSSLQGVTVVLKLAGSTIATQTTGADGSYTFTGLCAGVYTVEVDASTLPPGFTPAPCKVGGDTSVDSDCGTTTVLLDTNGETDDTIDFGFCAPCDGRIGDFVWQDLGDDNLQGPGDPGIAGVRVLLMDENQVMLAQTTTDSDGAYEFAGLCPGTYRVSFDPETVPTSLSPVLCDFGIDDTIDSDCSPATVVLTDVDDEDETVDFGFRGCSPCEGGVTALTLRYQGQAQAFIEVKGDDGDGGTEVFFSGAVDPLGTLSFFGTSSDGKLPKDLFLFVDGGLNANIHTSCSQPVNPGTLYGDFQIVSAASREGGVVCPCGPCDGGLTSLTLASLLPDVAFVEVKKESDSTGEDVFFSGVVAPLTEFTFFGSSKNGKFPKDIRVFVDDKENFKLKTNCSQPAGPGTQLGDFMVTAGASKGNGPICDWGPEDLECVDGAKAKVRSFTAVYTGDNDDVVITQQSEGSHAVDDKNGGPNGAASVLIVVRNPPGSKVWFTGVVDLGETFEVGPDGLGEPRLDNQTFVEIYDASGTTLLQLSQFHTSCSEPFTVDDQYGAVDITGMVVIPQ